MTVPPQEWRAVTLSVPSGCEDDLVGMISNLVLGIRVAPGGSGVSTFDLYVESDADLAALQTALTAALNRLGIESVEERQTVRSVPDGRWVETYQESLRPFTAGERFVIHPGDEPPDPGATRIPIVLVPGRAFGTGEHATTRLCLSALETAVVCGSRWLDVGCGSGILSVAAAKLGATAVSALDNDRDSVGVCREVLAANGVSGTVQVLEGSLERIDGPGYDGVVVNIHAPFFMKYATDLRKLLSPGGALICTGFLESDIPEISCVLQDAGLKIRACLQDGGWGLILAETPS